MLAVVALTQFVAVGEVAGEPGFGGFVDGAGGAADHVDAGLTQFGHRALAHVAGDKRGDAHGEQIAHEIGAATAGGGRGEGLLTDDGLGVVDGQHGKVAAVAEMFVHLAIAGGDGDLGHEGAPLGTSGEGRPAAEQACFAQGGRAPVTGDGQHPQKKGDADGDAGGDDGRRGHGLAHERIGQAPDQRGETVELAGPKDHGFHAHEHVAQHAAAAGVDDADEDGRGKIQTECQGFFHADHGVGAKGRRVHHGDKAFGEQGPTTENEAQRGGRGHGVEIGVVAHHGRRSVLEEDAVADERAAKSRGQRQTEQPQQIEFPTHGLDGAGGGHEEHGEKIEGERQCKTLGHGGHLLWKAPGHHGDGARYIGPPRPVVKRRYFAAQERFRALGRSRASS